jgi:multidrug efflux pump subunit AcrA (membrane-fusion protein)
VFTLDTKTRPRPPVQGRLGRQRLMILSGLNPGDQVILDNLLVGRAQW